jgi:hypothetical protein
MVEASRAIRFRRHHKMDNMYCLFLHLEV